MKTKILALLLFAGSCVFAGPRFVVGVGVGLPGYGYGYYAPAPPPVPYGYSYAAPAYAAPGYGYSWVPGYYDYVGGRYGWRAGYWAHPPYRGAYWYGPRYYGGRYYHGYLGHRRSSLRPLETQFVFGAALGSHRCSLFYQKVVLLPNGVT